ncbi:iron ABC transporter permease [Cupriavidus sp. SK-3]|uniref:ABC transporter permease n=1 Tax=Cupriavidus TaxID=106589 RepID=UPI000450996C|nr:MULTISPECIES: iron ABC transporter permease [Cupriavidus]KDP89119.1 iron ABC transporter permease [Cupriavidus sp. SK-3]MDF3881821.1 iron ABC transporter permease [Cupriavidus basilensis]
MSLLRPSPTSRLHPLALVAGLSALLIALPIAQVASSLLTPSGDTWRHLADTVLAEYVVNTLWLLAGVCAGVLLLGVPTAWLVSTYRFTGRAWLEWALVLPLAMPAYVIAYAYTDALQFAGPVQGWLRELTGWRAREYWFPDIRSLGGAIVLFTLVLYPYVYLTARAAFLQQTLNTLEAARLLGYGTWGSVWRIMLPLARPGIVAGTALALMETLADFGTVAYFGIPTFSTGIYRAWFSLGDKNAAAQLSAFMLVFVIGILLAERISRGRARVHGGQRRAPAYRLHGWRAALALLVCVLPVLLGFAIPALMLCKMALAEGDAQFGPRFIGLVRNSFLLASVTALVAVLAALLIGYAGRGIAAGRNWLLRALTRVCGMGYALPGSVVAVGVLVPVARLDNAVSSWLQQHLGWSAGLLLTGGIAALVYAYLVRFLGVALQTVNAGLVKITPGMDAASRSLGHGPGATLRRVHLPMLRGSLLTAALIVFVDVMKELPATFVMRPFNFDTLAVQAYNLASDERLAEAATASLVIVAVGLLPVILLSRSIRRDARE